MFFRSKKPPAKKPSGTEQKKPTDRHTAGGGKHRASTAQQEQRADKSSHSKNPPNGNKSSKSVKPKPPQCCLVKKPGGGYEVRKVGDDGRTRDSPKPPQASSRQNGKEKKIKRGSRNTKSQAYTSLPPASKRAPSPATPTRGSGHSSRCASAHTDSSRSSSHSHIHGQTADPTAGITTNDAHYRASPSPYDSSGFNGGTTGTGWNDFTTYNSMPESNTYPQTGVTNDYIYSQESTQYSTNSYGMPEYTTDAGYNDSEEIPVQIPNLDELDTNNEHIQWISREDNTSSYDNNYGASIPTVQSTAGAGLFNYYDYHYGQSGQNANIYHTYSNTEEVNQEDDTPEYIYIWGRLLGKGSFGSVKKLTCKNVKTGAEYSVAVKIFNGKRKNKRFEKKEVKTLDLLKNLDHKNIIKYYGEYDIGGVSCFSFELMNGDLHQATRQKHKQGKYWSCHEISYITQQILEGLEYLSNLKQPIVHCDLKPENVLLDGQAVKITDFGLSIRLKRGQEVKDCRSSGTSNYLACERFLGQAAHNSDIWSLWVLVYHLAECDDPADWTDFKDQYKKQLREQYRSLGYDVHSRQFVDMANYNAITNFIATLEDIDNLYQSASIWNISSFRSFIKYLAVVNWQERPSARQALNHHFITKYSTYSYSY